MVNRAHFNVSVWVVIALGLLLSPSQTALGSVKACTTATIGKACDLNGEAGTCGSGKCCRFDYTKKTPGRAPPEVCSPCIICVVANEPAELEQLAPTFPSDDAPPVTGSPKKGGTPAVNHATPVSGGENSAAAAEQIEKGPTRAPPSSAVTAAVANSPASHRPAAHPAASAQRGPLGLATWSLLALLALLLLVWLLQRRRAADKGDAQ